MTFVGDDLRDAALVFLQGSEPPNGGRHAQTSISQPAVGRVARTLEDCDVDARSAIARALARYRRERSWRNREAVIEAVTVAVVPASGSQRTTRDGDVGV